jgi:exosortase
MAIVAQMPKPNPPAARSFAYNPAIWAGLLLASTLWSYLPSLADMVTRWVTDPQYSHGFLVPLFSAYLLWSRRSVLASSPATGHWLGVGLIGVGLVLRAAGVLLFFGWLEAVSILPCLAGCVTVLAGRKGLRWAYPAILFLLFMIPLPYAVQTAMSGSLQRTATGASTYLLVTLGVPAVAEGNVILLSNDTRLAVVAACSGLGMVVSFLALSTGLAVLLTGEPVWARAAVVLSTGPVAVGVNTLRITVTGLLYDRSQDEWARWVYHDVAGWLMMPVGLTLFFGLLWAARRVIVPVPVPRLAAITARPSPRPAG